jgi:hypothetical protein
MSIYSEEHKLNYKGHKITVNYRHEGDFKAIYTGFYYDIWKGKKLIEECEDCFSNIEEAFDDAKDWID